MTRIIAMDEVGEFEPRDKGVRFLGGFVIDGDYVQIKKDIEIRLKQLCNTYNQRIKKEHSEYNVVYPLSLHGSGAFFYKEIENDKGKQWEAIPRGKCRDVTKKYWDELQKDILEYLKKYSFDLFMYLDPYTGGGYDDNEGIKSNVADLMHGANRYERMAIQAVYHQIFYTLDDEADEYIFEIATRTLQSNNQCEELYQNNNGRVYITNTSTYKTAISTMLYEKGINTSSRYEFKVAPINYSSADKKSTTPFTYIADIVCSYMRGLLNQKFGINEFTYENKVTSKGLVEIIAESDIELKLYIYSKSDSLYRKMVEAIKDNRIIEYYSYLFDIESQEDSESYKEFYIENWITVLDKIVAEKLNNDTYERRKFRDMIDRYISFVEGYMGSREISYEKGMYVVDKLIRNIENQQNWEKKNAAMFKLYDIKMRAFNHRGAVDEVKKCASICNLYKGYVNTEDYILHILRIIEYYLNGFKYEEALEVSKQLKDVGDRLEKAYGEVYEISEGIANSILGQVNPVQSRRLVLIGKIYSNLAQVYAFLNDYDNSKKIFREALKKFSKDSADYKITQSYYLHLLIEHNKFEEYMKESFFYFEASDLKLQMENALKYNAYSMLVFIKALNKFYMRDDLYVDIIDEFVKKIEEIDNYKRQGHPWELIYKHLSECLLYAGTRKGKDKEKYERLAEKYGNMCWYECNKNADTTIIAIQLYAQLEFMKLSGKAEKDGGLTGFREKEVEVCKKVFGLEQPITYNALKDILERKVTYMYR